MRVTVLAALAFAGLLGACTDAEAPMTPSEPGAVHFGAGMSADRVGGRH